METETPLVSVCIETLFDDESYLDRVDRVARTEADAVEFWHWREKDLEGIASRVHEHGLELAAMIAGCGDLADPETTEKSRAALREAIDAAEAVDCNLLIVTAGDRQPNLDRVTQQRTITDALREVAPAAEAAGVTLGLEPLNPYGYPDNFLETAEQGFAIVDAVDSPAVRLLYDVFHQQQTEGNLISVLAGNADLVAHVHVADVPTRNEPGTGEVNFGNVFGALREAGYSGSIGCEHYPTGRPEATVDHVVDLVRGDGQ